FPRFTPIPARARRYFSAQLATMLRLSVHAFGLWIVGAALFVRAEPAKPATSPWAHVGSDGKLAYQALPAGDRIMDFSSAGYMGGGVALPEVPVRKTVRPSGDDDTAAIQAALDEVAALVPVGGFRGAVLLERGEFHCGAALTL